MEKIKGTRKFVIYKIHVPGSNGDALILFYRLPG